MGLPTSELISSMEGTNMNVRPMLLGLFAFVIFVTSAGAQTEPAKQTLQQSIADLKEEPR